MYKLLTTCILNVCKIIRCYKRKAEETCTPLLDAIARHQEQRLKKIVLPNSDTSDDDFSCVTIDNISRDSKTSDRQS